MSGRNAPERSTTSLTRCRLLASSPSAGRAFLCGDDVFVVVLHHIPSVTCS
jgi:hypothetical protein